MADGGPSEAVSNALRSAENAAKQNSAGNPMELNAIHFAKGFGETAGFDKPVSQGVDKKIQDTVDQGNLVKSVMPIQNIDGLKNLQTKDVRGMQDVNLQTVPTLKHGVASQGQG